MMRILLIIPFLFLACNASYVLEKPTQQLPTPNSSYVITPNQNVDISGVIKEYIVSNFDQKKSKKVIQLNSNNKHNCCGCEVCIDPTKKKLYGNIIITDTQHCDSPKNIFEFIGYEVNDVAKVLKVLLKDSEYYKWSENYFDVIDFDEDIYTGFVEVMEVDNGVIVIIGVDGCQI